MTLHSIKSFSSQPSQPTVNTDWLTIRNANTRLIVCTFLANFSTTRKYPADHKGPFTLSESENLRVPTFLIFPEFSSTDFFRPARQNNFITFSDWQKTPSLSGKSFQFPDYSLTGKTSLINLSFPVLVRTLKFLLIFAPLKCIPSESLTIAFAFVQWKCTFTNNLVLNFWIF